MFQALLKNFQKKLVNLSGTNKAILLLKLSKENDLDLNETDYLLNKPSFSIIENLLAGKSKFPICQLLDSRNEKMNLVGRQLQRISRKDRFLFEESGSQDLYVGWPFARGKFVDGSLVHCPFLFFPVSLELEDNTWYLKQRENEAITLNKSFLLAWQHYNQVSVSEEFLETSFDSFSKNSKEFRTALYDLVKAQGLEINYNSDLFVDRLDAFKQYKAAELAQITERGRVKLFNEAVLGIFPQAGSALVQDYDKLMQSGYKNLDEFLSFQKSGSHTIDTEITEQIKESDLQTPLAMDASQENAIVRIKGGRSLVVQGPPGTGKSQLICNLVSDYISSGKRVLVGCQKRAALDVVYKRIEQIGAGDFVSLMHDFKADRNLVYEKIARQIDGIEAFKKEGASLDTVFLERKYLDACRRIDHLVAELESFKLALFDTQECGVSVKELYLNSNVNLPLLAQAETFYWHFPQEKFQAFQNRLKYLLPYAIVFDDLQHPWSERMSFKNFTPSDKLSILQSLSAIEEFKVSFVPTSEMFARSIEEFKQLEECTGLLFELREISKSDLFYLHFNTYTLAKGELAQLTKRTKWLEKWRQQLTDLLEKPLAVGISLESIHFTISKVEKAQKAQDSWLGKLRWNWFAKERAEVQGLLRMNRLPEDAKGLAILLERINNSLVFLTIKEGLQKRRDFDFGDENTAEAYLDKFDEIEKALSYSQKWQAANKQHSLPIQLEGLSRERFSQLSAELHAAIRKVETAYQGHSRHFTIKQLHKLFNKEIVAQTSQALENSFEEMVEFDKARDELAFHEGQLLKKLIEVGHELQGKTLEEKYLELAALFENSIRVAWIHHIEKKYPILRAVSTTKMNLMEEELAQHVADKQRLSQEILLLKLQEQTYKNEELNRLGNRTTYRELHHQVTKKKKIWSLRKTLESFHHEVFYLLPCWLASPETVSTVFPMENLFDLVIFDEASQCFAERGIPAMARGKQVVVAGDEKQLPPSDLYKTRYSEDDENVPDTELNSLLDLAGKYLPQVMLTEHYRSQSLDLIDFSNQHFYQNKLALLPDFQTFQNGHRGIEYVKVNGIFENHCNWMESEEVVQRCLWLFQTQPEKEIGVITFNIHQQTLIQDALEQRCAEQRRSIPESFIIKNIENIQGDEKDIILFSVGYAPDRSGRMQHHFGSLNLMGGENRLNVAVTRAREKVVVVTSIFPHQLNVDATLHEGPKLLKKYLDYALNVSEGRFLPTLPKKNGFRSEWFLKEKLKRQASDMWKEELPFADLTERDAQGRLVKLVLTDDDKFYHALSVKESFVYLPSTLRKKNWKFERVWSRNV